MFLRVRPGHLFVALLRPAGQPAAQAWLGLCYAGLAWLAVVAGNGLDGGEVQRLFAAMLAQPIGSAAPLQLPPLSERGELVLALKVAVVALGSMPLWHAPALVHWGRQGVGPALFGSVVALWRTRWAFLNYMAGWLAVLVITTAALMLAVLALGPVALMVLMPVASLVLTAVFYITLWFGFEDTFDIRRGADPGGPDVA